ncbi:MAG: alpha/beta hydrolase [Nocardiopsaceae bacterium]|jgi:pimeloyl-ACP methyl ester carboxylesterase|nr:alpha/beta hydrolase [Nocardiopsaceae bacterium]
MTEERFTVTAPDGRTLAVLTAGPADGLPFVMHNGTPGGLLALPSMTEAAAARGLRTVICARPGYGESTPRPGRRVADVADDVAAVLAALGAGEFVTLGWSGGGPHALACAVMLPGRCLAAATMAGVAPHGAPGLDWLAGMAPENVEEFTAADAGEEPLTRYLEAAAAELGGVTADQVAASFGELASAADQAAMTGELAEYLAASLRTAVAGGVAGWRDDDLAFIADWGFPLDDPHAAPVTIWQGDQDRMVPYAHGSWLAEHVPGARAHLLPGEGHLTLAVSTLGAILDDLLAIAGRA